MPFTPASFTPSGLPEPFQQALKELGLILDLFPERRGEVRVVQFHLALTQSGFEHAPQER